MTLRDLGTFTPPHGPERPVRAYVPRRVDVGRPHATLFLLDGQNVFGDDGSYAGGWHAHEAVERMGPSFHAPVIVAVDNGGAERIHEMGTHVRDFVDALVTQLVPRVRAELGGGGARVIGGASLGGLASLVAWLHHPDTFDAALAMSPSLWFAHRRWPRQIERGDVTLPARGKLYLDAGRRERGHLFADAEALARWLLANGLPPARLMWRPDAKGAHHERHWRRRLPKALRFAFRVGAGRGARPA